MISGKRNLSTERERGLSVNLDDFIVRYKNQLTDRKRIADSNDGLASSNAQSHGDFLSKCQVSDRHFERF